MEHPRGIANAARIHGHIDDLLLDVGCLACVAIFQEKCAPAPFEALPTAIPLLALPRHAMAHNIRALTVGAGKYLKNHESTLVCWSFSASRPRIEDSRSTPLKHLPPAIAPTRSDERHWHRQTLAATDTRDGGGADRSCVDLERGPAVPRAAVA